jgi:deazaflavin-dependent oxidoreductase (nitroreductase family)
MPLATVAGIKSTPISRGSDPKMAETSDDYNTQIIAEFRVNGGRVGGQWEDIPLLLLHHTGAESGVHRVNPIAYLPDETGYLVWAANGGAPRNPAWYHNLTVHPNTRIEIGGETIDVVAKQATGDHRDRLFARATERYPQLAGAARKTARVIPMIVLTPRPTS